ncbi:MAG: hypothetical protein CMP10_16205 [Zetaproteobacteria bacterium]|nr:hypothetical protein [Pseudobdellovibrionaceae bacterium]|tara:strand:- start:1509 stop:1805 length:297 start_codon:yes stop_codon:yes gene_type:complete
MSEKIKLDAMQKKVFLVGLLASIFASVMIFFSAAGSYEANIEKKKAEQKKVEQENVEQEKAETSLVPKGSPLEPSKIDTVPKSDGARDYPGEPDSVGP